MRRICLIGVCCIAAQLAVPASAYAWWEYIEAFSGPAFGWGWDIELRVACVTRPDPDVVRQILQTVNSNVATLSKLEQSTQTVRTMRELGGWTEHVNQWTAANQDLRGDIVRLSALVQPLLDTPGHYPINRRGADA